MGPGSPGKGDGKNFPLFQPVQTAALWNRINLNAAEYGESYMEKRYLRIRFEDLCQHAEATTKKMFNFLCPKQNLDIHPALGEIVPPLSIGRWRNCHDPELINRIHYHAKKALMRFSYI